MLFPFLLALFELAVYLSNDMYLPALPAIKHSLHTSNEMMQLSMTAWFLGGSLFHLLIGPISDRVGRRPVIFVSGIVFIASSIACAAATSIEALLIARFFQGTTVSAVAVAGYASVHELLDDARAQKTISMMTAITVIAPAFGPFFGGLILAFTTWDRIFSGLAGFTALVLLLLCFGLPEGNPRGKRQPLRLASVLKTYGNIIRNREFRAHTLTVALLFGGTTVWIVVSPFLVVDEFRHTSLEFGLIQALIFSGFVFGAGMVKPLTGKVGVDALLRISLGINFAGGLAALVLTSVYPTMLAPIIAAFFLYSIGTGLSYALFQRQAIASSLEPAGAKMAVFATVMVSFAALGSVVVTFFYKGNTSSLGVIMVLICSLTFFTFRRALPSDATLAKAEAAE